MTGPAPLTTRRHVRRASEQQEAGDSPGVRHPGYRAKEIMSTADQNGPFAHGPGVLDATITVVGVCRQQDR